MAPPRRGAGQPHQPRRLRRDRVDRDHLLLLADGVQEAERVRAEAGEADDDHDDEARGRAGEDLATRPARERHERQQQPGADLHADAGGHAGRGRAGSARAERQAERQREQHERVVVGAADGEHEQHRVQAHERRREAPRGAEPARGARHERDRAEARGRGQRFEDPHRAREPERRRRVAGEREQGAIRRVLEGPAEEVEDGVRRRFRGQVRVRVEAVQRAHARICDVAEDVLREQRRREREHDVGEHDRAGERAQRQPPRAREHEQVAAAHDERERLEAVAGEAEVQAGKRSREPSGPAAAAGGHEAAGRARGARGDQEGGRHDACEPERAKGAGGRLDASSRPHAGCRRGRGDEGIVTCAWTAVHASTRPASLSCNKAPTGGTRRGRLPVRPGPFAAAASTPNASPPPQTPLATG